MRIYAGKNSLKGKEKKDLAVIVEFIVTCYFLLYFLIKCNPTTLAAPGIVFTQMTIIRDHIPKAVRDVVKPRVDESAWYAHSEHLLLFLLASDDEENRRFAISSVQFNLFFLRADINIMQRSKINNSSQY